MSGAVKLTVTGENSIKGTLAGKQSVKGKLMEIPSLDETLTKEGYAADAKAVGERLKEKAPISHTEDTNNPHRVTAAQVGARPDTWLPSASEIGARPDTWTPTASEVGARADTWTPTASEVGARPDTWMPTAAQVGAAPSGYGLGTGGVFVTDCNKAIKPGFYATAESTLNLPDWYIAAYSAMLVTERQGEIYQKLFMNAIYGYTEIVRYSGDGGTTWSEWEWVNPLKITGAEYRTTERWNGKVVYAKMVDFGELPSSATKTVYIADGITDLVRVDGDIETILVSIATATYVNHISIANNNSLQIMTTQNCSGLFTYPCVYYCKG